MARKTAQDKTRNTTQDTSRYRVSALTEKDGVLLLRVIACLGRHCIEIESFRCHNPPGAATFEHELTVRTRADRIRRAVKQIGACVGVASVDWRIVEDDGGN